ncbi:MAG TPA: hypothetical protein VGF67_03170 [Ktedonobacteraceae bacterium]
MMIFLQKTGLKAPRLQARDEKPAPAGAIPLLFCCFMGEYQQGIRT